jgi:hypothetical protein
MPSSKKLRKPTSGNSISARSSETEIRTGCRLICPGRRGATLIFYSWISPGARTLFDAGCGTRPPALQPYRVLRVLGVCSDARAAPAGLRRFSGRRRCSPCVRPMPWAFSASRSDFSGYLACANLTARWSRAAAHGLTWLPWFEPLKPRYCLPSVALAFIPPSTFITMASNGFRSPAAGLFQRDMLCQLLVEVAVYATRPYSFGDATYEADA